MKVGIPKDAGLDHVAIKIIDKKVCCLKFRFNLHHLSDYNNFEVLRSYTLQDAQFDAESLEQEIAVMKKVNHPNCIKLHEASG